MQQIEPLAEFLERTAAAEPSQYAEAIHAAAERWGLASDRVIAEFSRMKEHILHYYEGVTAVHSFLDGAGRPVDCVPFDQQPTVRAARAAGYPIDAQPPQPSRVEGAAVEAQPAEPVRACLCPAGTVPLLRLTLERMISLGTFEKFFHKAPHSEADSTV